MIKDKNIDQNEFKQIIWICNNTTDEEVIKSNAEKVLQSNNPYYICDFFENVEQSHTKNLTRKFEDKMAAIGDIVHTYEFMFLLVDMGIKEFDLKRFEALIRESGNPKLMLYSLGFVDGIDKEEMLKALYKTKNAKYIEILSTSEDYEDLNVCERPEYAEKLKIAKEYDYFPKSLEEFKIEDRKSGIKELISQVMALETNTPELERKKAYLINELANYIEYLSEYHSQDYDVETLKQSISLLQRAETIVAANEPLHLYEFASSVNTDNKDEIIDEVVKNNHPKYLHYCLKYVSGISAESKKKLESTLSKSKNKKYNPNEDRIQGGNN